MQEPPQIRYTDDIPLVPGDIYETYWSGLPGVQRVMLVMLLAEENAAREDHPYGSDYITSWFRVMDIATGDVWSFSSSHDLCVARLSQCRATYRIVT